MGMPSFLEIFLAILEILEVLDILAILEILDIVATPDVRESPANIDIVIEK